MANNSGTWDLPALSYRNSNPSAQGIHNSSHVPLYNSATMLNTPLGRVHMSSPPPVPARPVKNNYNSGYNSYSSPFNSYGYGGYSSFGNYGGFNNYGNYGFNSYRPGFGSYGFPSGGYYNNAYPENRFIQMAEESSRPAFQSIQSVLHAFSSITMMFESSFNAIYSSYMSVIGVADNFSKLRNVFGQIFSAFTIFKGLNWTYRKLLVILGIRKELYSKESIWSDALTEVSKIDSENKLKNRRKNLSMLLFLSILFGGPYILFKLLSELNPEPVQKVWVPSQHPGSLAVGLYNFQAASEQELNINAQQKLMIAPKEFQPTNCPGWVLACNENRKIGLVPNNYIGVLMQSEKTGQTYIEHEGQTYQNPGNHKNFNENNEKSLEASEPTNVETSNEIFETFGQ